MTPPFFWLLLKQWLAAITQVRSQPGLKLSQVSTCDYFKGLYEEGVLCSSIGFQVPVSIIIGGTCVGNCNTFILFISSVIALVKSRKGAFPPNLSTLFIDHCDKFTPQIEWALQSFAFWTIHHVWILV